MVVAVVHATLQSHGNRHAGLFVPPPTLSPHPGVSYFFFHLNCYSNFLNSFLCFNLVKHLRIRLLVRFISLKFK
jgi:hypothetical protein